MQSNLALGFFANTQESLTLPKRETTTNTTALFAEDRLEVTDRFNLITGVRTEQINVESKQLDLNTLNDGTIVGNEEDDFTKKWDATTARLGLTYEFIDDLVGYAQASNAISLLPLL